MYLLSTVFNDWTFQSIFHMTLNLSLWNQTQIQSGN